MSYRYKRDMGQKCHYFDSKSYARQRHMWKEYARVYGTHDTGPDAHHAQRNAMIRRMKYARIARARLQEQHGENASYWPAFRQARQAACLFAGVHLAAARRSA